MSNPLWETEVGAKGSATNLYKMMLGAVSSHLVDNSTFSIEIVGERFLGFCYGTCLTNSTPSSSSAGLRA